MERTIECDTRIVVESGEDLAKQVHNFADNWKHVSAGTSAYVKIVVTGSEVNSIMPKDKKREQLVGTRTFIAFCYNYNDIRRIEEKPSVVNTMRNGFSDSLSREAQQNRITPAEQIGMKNVIDISTVGSTIMDALMDMETQKCTLFGYDAIFRMLENGATAKVYARVIAKNRQRLEYVASVIEGTAPVLQKEVAEKVREGILRIIGTA